MSEPKFIVQATGLLSKYRLEIFKTVCPDVLKHIIIFTDQHSYNHFNEYYDIFNFVILDQYREGDQFSLDNEILIECETEEEHLIKMKDFYGSDAGRFYPWEIHRYALKYCIENNILNFAFVNSDFIFYNDSEIMDKMFKSIPPGTFYLPLMGEENDKREWLWKDLQHKFKNIELSYNNTLKSADGFFRGCHFYNKDDMKLFFNIWNEGIKIPITKQYGHNQKMAYTDFVFTWVVQVFEAQKNYKLADMYKYIFLDGKNIGRHYTRPEDTIFTGEREGWQFHNFDYSDTSTISNFIKNNKQKLDDYYNHTFNVTITENHIFTEYRQ